MVGWSDVFRPMAGQHITVGAHCRKHCSLQAVSKPKKEGALSQGALQGHTANGLPSLHEAPPLKGSTASQ